MAHSASPISQASASAAAVPGSDVLAIKPQSIRILLAGDASGSAAQALRALFTPPEHALELTAVSSVTTLIPTLGVVAPEIILLDLAVAYPHPKETIRRVRRAAPHIPLIVLADEAQKEEAKLTLAEGVMDYVLREFMNDSTLARVLRGALERNTLEALADFLRDPITGLYTRDGLLTLGANTMDTTRRNRGSLALFCILLQNLSSLRDRNGNTAADHALQDVTTALSNCFRRSDILARIGESQFAVLAVDSTSQGMAIMRQRLERLLAAVPNRHDSSNSLHFSIYGGLWTSADDQASFPEFLDQVESGLRIDAIMQVPA